MFCYRQNKVIYIAVVCVLFVTICIHFNVSNETKTSKFIQKPRKFQTNENQNENKNTANWIVVTSINEPNEQMKTLAHIKNFKLLVIADQKSKASTAKWNDAFPNKIIHLNLNEQESLNLKSFSTTPLNSYTRKNLGYLYAIQNGARFIYDTDDDNSPLVDINEYFNFDTHDHGLIFENVDDTTINVYNPYAHFGQPLIWPRGFPLTQIQQTNESFRYVCGRRKTSWVQQGVVNGDPDVDAIFRLTKSHKFKRIDIKFDPISPSIQYPSGSMAPYNAQNTFFHYEAFWSLYLPKTVSIRVTDIWRSYWAQRLIWLLNGAITFNGPSAYQLRSPHSYLKDFKQVKILTLIVFLHEIYRYYKCEKTITLIFSFYLA